MGISYNQITDIIISHAHLDHVGGLLDAEGNSLYPNATIYLSRIEHDLYVKGKVNFLKSKMNDTVFEPEIKIVKSILEKLKPQLKLIENGTTLFNCMKLDIVPGYTDGHLISTIYSQGDSLIHIADLAHTDLLFTYPEWGITFDSNFDLAIASRKRMFKEIYQNKSLIIGYHLPYPGVGYLKELKEDSYQWNPKRFATPFY